MKQHPTDRVGEWRAAHRILDCKPPPAATIAERKALERDTAKWLRRLFPGIYRSPFGAVHHEIIEAAEYTIDHGGRGVVAAPRGTGKSYVLAGVSLKALIQGRVRFPVLIPWKAKDLKQALGFWKNALCFNDEFGAFYPEWCAPFVASRGRAQKIGTYTDEDGTPIGAQLIVSEGMIVLPHSRGVIGGATINGNPLGLHYTTDAGEGLRPDLIFIDDPQDRDTAMSAAQIKSTIQLIDFDVSGMAGPDKAMPIVMACTVKQREDVAEHYLGHSEWRGVRVPQVSDWPADMKLWDAWNEIRLEGNADKDGGKAERKFYKAHKKAMQAGAAVTWKHRFIQDDTEDMPAQPDAIYSALFDFYAMGRGAFMAERQNAPMDLATSDYDLTPAMVCGHMAEALLPLNLPPGTTVTVGHCDINRAGLHWCIAGYDQQMTGHTPMWGRWPARGDLWKKNATEMDRKQAIFRGLRDLFAVIAGTQFNGGKLTLFLVDRGYEPDVVHRFAAASSYPFRIIPARGYAAHKYFPRKSTMIGRPMEGCHLTSSQFGAFLAFNADLWRETSQRAFLGEVGEPGGFTLFTDRDGNERHHLPFAEQVCAEKLVNKYETAEGMRWEWRHRPGSLWDWGDALTGCWVAAAASGLSPSGEPVIVAPAPSRRRVRHVAV